MKNEHASRPRSLAGRWALFLLAILVVSRSAPAFGQTPSGAIFTTLLDGSIVDLNQFPTKEDVYLDGGPGPGAPQEAAGLDDGIYVFMVTDPSGKTLLSTDAAQCREFTVSGGIITGVVAAGGCEHLTGFDIDHGALTVQLFPFLDTPNPGGVYKVWATPLSAFPASCLGSVDCEVAGTWHGFKNSSSKTDNFKVTGENVREIDTYFFADNNKNGVKDKNEGLIPNIGEIWTDTLGVANPRYADPAFTFGTMAHVEVPEADQGVHYLTIPDQNKCKVGPMFLNGNRVYPDSSGRVAIDVSVNINYLLQVACQKGAKSN